ncbi:MAG: 3-phosphoserine/phosphohydroxythreonine transaminase [Phycisphaerales bacterium]|nr:3-phosphoserine/phosphohydroxythreonine transaminase [Phycisphaerales bacterium]
MSTTQSPHRIWNFSAGPSTIPLAVLTQLREDLIDLDGTGVGILEHSHRGATYDRLLAEAGRSCRALGEIPEEFEILFVSGGATNQFSLIPLNFLADGATADYPDTEVWSAKAIIEARDAVPSATIAVPFAGKEFGYDHVPEAGEMTPTPGAAYLHYCSNNTVHGTRFHNPPKAAPGVPLVCDASSEIFGRPMDWSKHALVYAAAQKHLGVAAMSLVIARREMINKPVRHLPSMFLYGAHAKYESRINTPPTFAIHTAGLMFRWMIQQGGVREFERRNDAKAALIYGIIDGSGGFYRGISRLACRSPINVSFRLPTEVLDQKFIGEAARAELDGLAGHRDAGGIRASMYNAMPHEGAEALASFMRDFIRRNG